MFELHITCSKDIDELHINFSDGTCVTSSGVHDKADSKPKKTPKNTQEAPTPKNQKTRQEAKPKSQPKEDYLDLDSDFGEVSQDVIEKPNTDLSDRPIKVADELQYMDI